MERTRYKGGVARYQKIKIRFELKLLDTIQYAPHIRYSIPTPHFTIILQNSTQQTC